MQQPPFVKKFDFRGIYNKDITDADAYYLGIALTQTITIKKILIGWDTRPSSKNLAFRFIKAMLDKNVEVFYLDQCPIDYITAAAYEFDFDLSVMFTGSHHPWNWTGLLMHTQGGDSIQGELVDTIVANYYEAKKETYSPTSIDLIACNDFMEEIEETYTKKIQSLIPLDQIKELNILVDLGDGAGSRSLTLLEKLIPQVHFTRIHDRKLYDEQSSHIADPSNKRNMQDLIDQMQEEQFDCGFAFDSDADRVLAVDEKGTYLDGSLLGSAMIDSFTHLEHKNTLFGYAVDCGPSIYNTVTNLNEMQDQKLSAVAVPVGRSILRQMLRDQKVHFAIENVGHFYSRDFFMTDSATFSLTVMLYWISMNGPLGMMNEHYPDGYRGQAAAATTDENTKVSETLHKLISHYPKPHTRDKKIEVDGIRYEFFDGETLTTWFTIRKSGYEPIVKYYFGSLNEDESELLHTTLQSLLTDE